MGVDYNPTQEDTQSWMEMTDLDGDGKVTLEDYEKLIIESLAKCGVRIYERDWDGLAELSTQGAWTAGVVLFDVLFSLYKAFMWNYIFISEINEWSLLKNK